MMPLETGPSYTSGTVLSIWRLKIRDLSDSKMKDSRVEHRTRPRIGLPIALDRFPQRIEGHC